MSDVGHNSGGVAADRLKSIIERIERLEEEKKAIGDDIREFYSEAKGQGFDIKVIRLLIRIRKMDVTNAKEQSEITALYMKALNMDESLPLFT